MATCCRSSLLRLVMVSLWSVAEPGFAAGAVDPGFPLQFTPDRDADLPGNCGVNGIRGGMCLTGQNAQQPDPDTTPFYQGQFSVGGRSYWHQIIGDPASGWAMEVYIERQFGNFFLSYSGGRNSFFFQPDYLLQSGNGWDPLAVDPARDWRYSGNGTGDPNKVIMRQVMGGTWDATTRQWQCDTASFCLEFLKGELQRKPTITQQLNQPEHGVTAYFQVDMSNSTYSDDQTPAVITNRLTVTTPGMPAVSARFDMAVDAPDHQATAGRYRYVPGPGWVDDNVETWDFQPGTYQYTADQFNVLEHDWTTYYSTIQNPRPGPGNERKCAAGAVTGGCP